MDALCLVGSRGLGYARCSCFVRNKVSLIGSVRGLHVVDARASLATRLKKKTVEKTVTSKICRHSSSLRPMVWIGGHKKNPYCEEDEIETAREEKLLDSVVVNTKTGVFSWDKDVIRLKASADIKDFYNLRDIIGHGTYGTVLKCESVEDGQTYALKRLPKKSSSRFRQEVLLASRVDHPSVLKPLKVLESPTELFTVSELCVGGELFEVIAEHNMYLGTLSEEAVLRITREMLVSLETCHRAGFAHLDVKPENFCFRIPWREALADDGNHIQGNLVLIDFGASQPFRLKQYAETNEQYDRDADDFFTGKSELGGTASYVCPEILLNGRFSSRSDLWSLGVTLFMLIAGRRPFDASFDLEQQKFDLEVQDNIRKQASLPLGESLYSTCEELGLANSSTVDLLLNMMNPDPQQRRSATELISEIDRILNEEL